MYIISQQHLTIFRNKEITQKYSCKIENERRRNHYLHVASQCRQFSLFISRLLLLNFGNYWLKMAKQFCERFHDSNVKAKESDTRIVGIESARKFHLINDFLFCDFKWNCDENRISVLFERIWRANYLVKSRRSSRFCWKLPEFIILTADWVE